MCVSGPLHPHSSSGSPKSSDQVVLAVPRTGLKADRAFEVVAPTLRNAPPVDQRSTAWLDSFKKQLKAHLFQQAFFLLCLCFGFLCLISLSLWSSLWLTLWKSDTERIINISSRFDLTFKMCRWAKKTWRILLSVSFYSFIFRFGCQYVSAPTLTLTLTLHFFVLSTWMLDGADVALAYVFELFENEQMNALCWIFQQLLKHWVPQATANIHVAGLWG